MNDNVLRRNSVTDGTVLRTEEGSPVIVGERLNRGGEGILRRVNFPDQVAKIYNVDIGNRENKLKDMIAANPNIEHLCWPTHLLYDQEGEFVGFLMPKLPDGAVTFENSVFQLRKSRAQEKVLPGWDRKDITNTAKIVAGMILKLHKCGILMGDISGNNFMLDPSDKSAVYLVDCDSYQFKDYPCPVGHEDYTHPGTAERLGVSGDLDFSTFLRTEEEEDYALGILLYRILFLGRHPFRCIDKTPAQAMREGSFPDRSESETYKLIRQNLIEYIKKAFADTFQNQHHIKVTQWVSMLDNFLATYDKRKYSRDLLPRLLHDKNPGDGYFKDDIECEICGEKFNKTTEKYYRMLSYGDHLLCTECRDKIDVGMKLFGGKTVKCAIKDCENSVYLNEDELVKLEIRKRLASKAPKKKVGIYCEEHSKEVEFCCDGCHHDKKTMYKWIVEKNKKAGKNTLCWDCLEKGTVTMKCSRNGCENDIELSADDFLKLKKNEKIYCKECSDKVTFICACCGKENIMYSWRFEENEKMGRDNLCWKCLGF